MQIKNRNYSFNKRVKGSSLSHAILLCLLLSIVSGALVLNSFFQFQLNNSLQLHEELMLKNQIALSYSIFNPKKVKYGISNYDDSENSINPIIEKSPWGYYDIIRCTTVHNNLSVENVVLAGYNGLSNELSALYITNYDKKINLSGRIDIKGNINIPDKSYNISHLVDDNSNEINIDGSVLNSNKHIPKIKALPNIDFDNYKIAQNINFLDGDSLVNYFHNQSIQLDMKNTNFLKNIYLKGNIIIKSNNPLFIENSAILEDVIVVAPEINVLDGFYGNAQFFATEKVNIHNEVELIYPSIIYVENDVDSVEVNVGQNSKVLGAIMVNGKTKRGAQFRYLKLDENSILIGSLYCYGKLELKGDVIGNVIADKLVLDTNSSKYENVLFNVTIDTKKLHEKFISPWVSDDEKSTEYAIIKQL